MSLAVSSAMSVKSSYSRRNWFFQIQVSMPERIR